jgi:hypothetical protein
MEHALLHVSEELLRGVEKELAEEAEPISGKPFTSTGYVDGSNVVEPRRSIHVAVFSVASILLKNGKYSALARGAEEPIVSVIVPKSYGEQRANLLMSIIELLAARKALTSSLEAILLDGSFISEMMTVFSHPKDAAEAMGEDYKKILDNLPDAEHLGIELEDRDISPKSVMGLFEEISEKAWQIYKERNTMFEKASSKKSFLDFVCVYVETTVYLKALRELLTASRELQVPLFWVAKDSETNLLVEKVGLEGWLNDVTLLDYAWRNLEDAYTTLRGKEFGRLKPCAADRKLVSEILGAWGNYSVLYFKLRKLGPVLQVTYPSYVDEDEALSALATLKELSDSRGYPKPLSYVHHMAVLNPEIARLVADEIYQRKADSIFRAAYAPSGRVKAGLR